MIGRKQKYLIFICSNLFLTSCMPIIQSYNPTPASPHLSYNSFQMYVDSVTLNLPHNKEYGPIIYHIFPENKDNKPFNKHIREHVKALLNYNGYKDRNESEEKLLLDNLLPIVVSLSIYSSNDKPLLLLNLRAKNFTLKTSNKHELLTYGKAFVHNKLEYEGLNVSALWSVTLGVEGEIPTNEEFTIMAMIKCVEPYLNKNFKDIITCKR